jgi:hypothetical protein
MNKAKCELFEKMNRDLITLKNKIGKGGYAVEPSTQGLVNDDCIKV